MSRSPARSVKRYVVYVGDRGRLVLPVGLRRELGVERGDALVFEERGRTVRLRSARELAASARGMFGRARDGRDLVDELLQERRHEAKREAEG